MRTLKVLFIILFCFKLAQSQELQDTLRVARIYNLSNDQVINNRSVNINRNTYHTFQCIGTGTWSCQIQYSDSSSSGPWSNFGNTGSLVDNTSTTGYGIGTGYHAYIRIDTSGTVTTINYAGMRDVYLAGTGSSGGGDVASVFGRTGAVVFQSGDATTDQVTEGNNLYFTNSRAVAAMDGLYALRTNSTAVLKGDGAGGFSDATNSDILSLLTFTPENVSNKDTNTSLGTSNTLYPTQNAVKSYVDTAVSGVTKTSIGLGNVDNTSDANKPISTAVQSALDLKEAANSNIQAHISSTSNPHSVTKTQVGLGNVDNTSDVNKPISTATQSALDLKDSILTFSSLLNRTGNTITIPAYGGNSGTAKVVTAQGAGTSGNCMQRAADGGIEDAAGACGGNYTISAGAGILISGSPISTIAIDDTTGMQYSVFASAPTGVGQLGEFAVRTDNNTFYMGTGVGWAVVSAVGTASPSATLGDIYLTNSSGAAGWGSIQVSGGITKTFSGSTITLGRDAAIIPTFSGNNPYTGRRITVPSSIQTLTASDAVVITSEASAITSASAIDLVSAPTIASGADGEQIVLMNVGGYRITFQDRGNLTGSNLCLVGDDNYDLLSHRTMQFIYSDVVGCWLQMGGIQATTAGTGTTWTSVTGDWASATGTWITI